jgi:transposase
VIHPEVPGTNNESERSLRGSAQDRRTVRTSKTEHGARRRTIIGSVLDSLRLHLPKPNLQAVHAQLSRWHDDGVSCFRRMVASLKIPERRLPEGVSLVLDLLVPSAETG